MPETGPGGGECPLCAGARPGAQLQSGGGDEAEAEDGVLADLPAHQAEVVALGNIHHLHLLPAAPSVPTAVTPDNLEPS